ncbi:hypothetical protein ACIBF5_19485 [Micromonospora sp. NPDC050417]|uniref:hypothetical protein n=1 Tax=Micromonospora sp. NPDC050417 TaxID=3364280 RepID=UPI0037AD9905
MKIWLACPNSTDEQSSQHQTHVLAEAGLTDGASSADRYAYRIYADGLNAFVRTIRIR